MDVRDEIRYAFTTPEEQVEHFGRFDGPAYKELSAEEQLELAKRAETGDEEAREKLITHNIPFALWYAKRYHPYGEREDVNMLAIKGLVRGVDKYDWRKGVKPVSYLVWWIRQSILEGVNKGKHVYVPLNQVQNDYKVRRVEDHARSQGRELTLEEACDEAGMAVEAIDAVRHARKSPIRLNQTPDEDDREYEIPSISLGFDLDAESDRMYLEQLITTSGLVDRQQRIVRLYFGIDDGHSRTLEEIGGMLGVTRERIRQIKERSLERMKERAERMDTPQAEGGNGRRIRIHRRNGSRNS